MIGAGVTRIGSDAFLNCSALESIVIPDSVRKLGDDVFSDCSKLTSIVIGNGVVAIGTFIFDGCSALENIEVPFVGEKAHYFIGDSNYGFYNRKSMGYFFSTSPYPGSVEIKQRVSYSGSGYYTYYIPASLRNVTVAGGDIISGAFSNFSMLTSISIGEKVNAIGIYAFA